MVKENLERLSGRTLRPNLLRRSMAICLAVTAMFVAANVSAADQHMPADSVNVQVSEGKHTLTIHIYFYADKSNVVEGFRSNQAEIAKLDKFVASLSQSSPPSVQAITLKGTCSIEAPYAHNGQLAIARTKEVNDYLQKRYSKMLTIKPTLITAPEDWATLRNMVDTSHMADKERVLAVIDGASTPDAKEANLKALDGGKPYRYILQQFSPRSRRVDVSIEYLMLHTTQKQTVTQAPPATAQPEIVEITPNPEPGCPVIGGETETHRRKVLYYPIVALKTNTLLWAGVTPMVGGTFFYIPNGGVEYYFGHRWSVEADAAYTFHTYPNREQLRGLSAYTGQVRYWFKRDDMFRWFYVGAYGMGGDYDYQDGRKEDQNTLTNYTGKHWGAGLSAGFMLPVYRGFCLEAGVMGGFRHYYTNVYDRDVSPYHAYLNHTTYSNQWGLMGLYLNVVYRFGKKAYKNE